MIRLPVFRLAAILAVVATPVLSAGAFAQSSPSVTPTSEATAPGAQPGTGSSPASEPTLPKAVSVKVAWHIKMLHNQLGITPAQQSEWAAFAQVMRDNAAEINQAFTDRSAKVASLNAAENMQSYAQLAQLHAANMQKLAVAFQSLYNSFPDQQKQVADDVFRKSNGMPLAHKK